MIKSTLILFLSFYMFASEAGSSDCTFTPPKYDDRWVAMTELLSPRYLNGESCADVQKRAFIDWINRRSPSDMKKLMKENARQQYPEAVAVSDPVENARIEYPDPVADPVENARIEYPDPVADTDIYYGPPVPVVLPEGISSSSGFNSVGHPSGGGGGSVGLPNSISGGFNSVGHPSGGGGGSVGLPESGGGSYNPYNCPACQCAESGATQ